MMLVANLLLALAWASLIGPFSPANIVVGFAIGFVVLLVVTGGGSLAGGAGAGQGSSYFRRSWALVMLIVFAVVELVIANIKVAWYTVTSLRGLRPAVLEIPLEPDLADEEITLLAALITLTPGTLTLDVSEDRRSMFVHFMHVNDAEAEIRSVKEGFERRILAATRAEPMPSEATRSAQTSTTPARDGAS
jgi:multicomponent Na+:H+ antiporter subunit E